MDASSNGHDKKKQDSPSLADIRNKMKLVVKRGVFTPVHLFDAGFKYTGDGDTARCNECGLEISNWTLDMNPLTIHSQQKPDCSFIRSTITSALLYIPPAAFSSTTAIRNTSISDKQENPSKRQKLETNNSEHSLITLFGTDLLQQVRRRTFSHWPHRTIPSSAQMIEAGFFNCNVGDRVICIYCNLICQQWTAHTDDPCEVHKTLSPNCKSVKETLIRPSGSSILIVNESPATPASSNHSPTLADLHPLRSNEIVYTAVHNSLYAELPKRHASFATWINENLPPVDSLVRAGFFYTGKEAAVTCFYCHGSLQNWGPNDNPMIEHARWFPHCAYAKQLCGEELYRKIQESKRAQQERASDNKSKEHTGFGAMSNDNLTVHSRQLLIPDESTLSRLVAARIKLPISQGLLDQNFKLSIIKRCWEDQLRLKQEDFVSECDLFIACLILQKQIEHIDSKKENIVVPSIEMKRIREQNKRMCEQSSTALNATEPVPNTTDADPAASPESLKNDTKSSSVNNKNQSNNSIPSNPCVLCLTEEKRLACIPCGHLATCAACGHSLRTCPICRREIEAFVRIYL